MDPFSALNISGIILKKVTIHNSPKSEFSVFYIGSRSGFGVMYLDQKSEAKIEKFTSGEQKKMLILAEELILVSIHPETGGEVFYHAWKQVKSGIAGALLMELALKKRIFSRHGKIILLSPKRTGNEILDRILGNIQRSSSHKSIDFWVSEIQDNMGYVMEKLLENFEKRGIIRKEARKHKFGIKMHYPIQKPALRTEIMERMRIFYADNGTIEDYRTYTLLYLLQSCDLCHVLRDYTRNYNRAQVFALIDQETRSNKQYVKEMLCCINSFISKRPIISIAV